jgi:hypothetical protein
VNPGIYQHIPFDEYLTWPYLSQSTIKEGRKSMAHMRAAMECERDEPTDAMLLGSALHVAFLEPELMPDRVTRWEHRRQGAEWEAFKHDNQGKIILTDKYYAHLIGMVRSLRAHPEVKKWLARIESTEISAVGDFFGTTCKARGDALTNDPLIDLKTVADGDPRKVRNQAWDLGYYIQAAVHTHLLKRDRFILLTVESTPPYDVCPWELPPAFIDHGKDEAREICDRYRECEKAGIWPGRSQCIQKLEAPPWLNTTPSRVRIA